MELVALITDKIPYR